MFLEALQTYADACTQPLLSPNCPYYRLDAGGRATCNEECQGVLEAHGVNHRPVTTAIVGGLLMTGRAVPKSAVAGSDDFDATQLFLQERGLAPAARSTASLLLETYSLVARAVSRIPIDGSAAFDCWGELLRREVAMDRVHAGGMAPMLARAASRQAVTEILVEMGVIGSQVLAESTDPVDGRTWGNLAQQIVSDDPPRQGDAIEVELGILGSVLAHHEDSTDEEAWHDLQQRDDLLYAMSTPFLNRVEEWFAGIASHDLESIFRPRVPSRELFLGFPGHPDEEAHGRWIWERFTRTDPASWALSSLLLEWQWTQGMTHGICGSRTMNERRIPVDLVMVSAMRAMDDRESRGDPDDLFHPGRYVGRAAAFLAAGEWSKAMGIFEGIVALSPGDGEAWNNLGFCQLGESATKALPHLRRGAALQNPVPLISTANQVLALHLLGRNEEAIALAAGGLASSQPSEQVGATVWLHPAEDGDLELGHADDVNLYLRQLRDHIEVSDCDVVESTQVE